MHPFQSLHNYEEFIYTLRQRYEAIQRSTLVVIPLGSRTAVVEGELAFANGYRITQRLPVRIRITNMSHLT